MNAEPVLKDHYELAIVGCGPAGMAAAINAKIRHRDFVLLGVDICSPKLMKAPRVDNFLGFPELKGEELRRRFLDHLAQMEIQTVSWKVNNIYPGSPFTLVGSDKAIEADAVVLATGVSTQKLFPGETELLGHGVGYCATCDGPLYKGKTVAVISYAPEGEHEATFLAGICRKVYYIPFHAPVNHAALAAQAEDKNGPEFDFMDSRVEVKKGKVIEISGAPQVETLKLDQENLLVDGVFILRESLPAEQLVPGLTLVEGAVEVNHQQETNIPGLFAAGDCTGQPYQLAKATGEGATAALQAIKYLDGLKQPSPVPAFRPAEVPVYPS